MATRTLVPHSGLSAVAQTAYAQLLESALAVEHSRTVADLPGSFATKTVKGRQYWSARTQVIDLADPGKSVSLLLASDFDVHVHEVIESLRMGLLPVASLTSAPGASYLNPREPDFRLDFLTVRHRGGDTPYEHPQLHITLQPL